MRSNKHHSCCPVCQPAERQGGDILLRIQKKNWRFDRKRAEKLEIWQFMFSQDEEYSHLLSVELEDKHFFPEIM